MSIRWAPSAERDLDEIWTYLATEASPTTADRVLGSIVGALARLEDWPLSGRARPEIAEGLRSLPVKNYLVFYQVTGPSVEIVRVLHGRRDLSAAFSDDAPA